MNYGTSCSESAAFEQWGTICFYPQRPHCPVLWCFLFILTYFWQDFTVTKAVCKAGLRGFSLTLPLSGIHIYLESFAHFALFLKAEPQVNCHAVAGDVLGPHTGTYSWEKHKPSLRPLDDIPRTCFSQTEQSLTTLNPLKMLKVHPLSNRSLGSQAGTISCN